ncbi:MAG: NRDE family protein [Gammaproteobacteria bacterium]|nr:NRDE family protein [Gammaproteobacteria bacterium]
MCVIAWAWKARPHWPLVVLANRDERHARASAPLDWWRHAPQILAGRDLEAGGSWLGVTRGGRFAALTNRAGAGPPGAPSRGELVSGALGHPADFEDEVVDIEARAAEYAGFNLLIGDGSRLACLSNRDASQTMRPGIHGMANGALDEAIPKVERLKTSLEEWGRTGQAPPFDDWLALLADASPASGAEPRSAIFVKHEIYGTRSSSIVTFGPDGRVVFVERGFGADGRSLDTRQFEFERAA